MKEFLPFIRAKRSLRINMPDYKAETIALIEKYEPCHRRTLTELSCYDTSSISYGLKELIQDGLIQKLNNSNYYKLTPLGNDLCEQIRQVTSKYQSED